VAIEVKLGGRIEHYLDDQGRKRARWEPARVVVGVPYDTPILGYHNNTANTLRLWQAEAPESFDFATFNRGDYYGAVESKVMSENLTKVLYPTTNRCRANSCAWSSNTFSCPVAAGHAAHHESAAHPLEKFHEKFTVQLNDTHPAIAVAELMRLLVDERSMDWEPAWQITTRHLRLHQSHPAAGSAGALVAWPVRLVAAAPSGNHLEINARFLDEVRLCFIDDPARCIAFR